MIFLHGAVDELDERLRPLATVRFLKLTNRGNAFRPSAYACAGIHGIHAANRQHWDTHSLANFR